MSKAAAEYKISITTIFFTERLRALFAGMSKIFHLSTYFRYETKFLWKHRRAHAGFLQKGTFLLSATAFEETRFHNTHK
jgi:hypothetical protein